MNPGTRVTLKASRIVSLATATAAALSILACGKKDSGPVEEATVAPVAEAPDVSFMRSAEWKDPVARTPQAICYDFVYLDIGRLRGKDNSRVSLDLPCADEITAVLTDFEDSPKDKSFIWHGEIQDDGSEEHRAVGLVTFSIVNEVLVGDVRTSGGRLFSIRYIAPKVSLIEELDPARFPPEEAVYPVRSYPVADGGDTPPGDPGAPDRRVSDIARAAAADLTGLARERATVHQPEIIYREQPSAVLAPAQPEPVVQYVTKSGTDSASTGTTNIDIVVAYTPAAATFQNHPDGILGKIREAVFHANESYRTGDVRQQITLVHMQQVDYSEKGSDSADLQELDHNMPRSAIRTTLDGLRSQHKADIVVLVTKEVQAQESCGVANQLQSLSSGFCNRAFAVVPVTCATSVYSFAHELGHLMGADHNKDGVRSGPPFEHSCGYVSPDNTWRTIMSTTTRACSAGTCMRILEWSRPSQYSGVRPTPLCSDRGRKDASESPDNALALNNTAAIVAKFSDACPTGTE